MKKSFFLSYKSNLSIDSIVHSLEHTLQINFVPHDSHFIGLYIQYKGEYCDSLKIMSNLTPDLDYQIDSAKDFSTVIKIMLEQGKNVDKNRKKDFQISLKLFLYLKIFTKTKNIKIPSSLLRDLYISYSKIYIHLCVSIFCDVT